MLVVSGLIHYTGFGNSSTQDQGKPSVTSSGTSLVSQRPRYGAMDLEIAYGSTPQQVLRQLGSPTKREANCWLYRGRIGEIRRRYSPYNDAMKFCFSEGPAGGRAVMQIFGHYPTRTIVKKDPLTHTIISKKTFPAHWGHPLWLMKVPDWYLQQNN